MATFDSLRLVWSADPARLLASLALSAAEAGAELSKLFARGAAIAAVVDGALPRSQARRVLTVGGLTVLSAVAGNANAVLQSRLGQSAARRAEGRILDVVTALELADVEDPAFQDRLQEAFLGAGRQSALITSSLGLPRGCAAVAISVAAMSTADRALVPLAITGAVPQWFLTRRSPDPMRAWSFRNREAREAGGLRHLLTSTTAAHELRAFGAAAFLRARHDELNDEGDRAHAEIVRRNGRRTVVSNLAGGAAGTPAAARLALRVARKETSLATAVAGGMATRQLSASVQRVVSGVAAVRRSAAMTTDLQKLTQPTEALSGPPPQPDFQRIVMENLGYRYRGADTPVLDGANLTIERGEVVALVGENGSGKTTLAKLLCCLYRPTHGTIRWDDVDVGQADPAAVRAHIAVVFQDFVRYPSLTAGQNIFIGRPDRGDPDSIKEAARRAGAHDVIAALPDGYDTILSRHFGGVDLSTGQWQRVALARAFFRDAPLVVLDEPTAALDPRAERALFETVASLSRSRSALLISHRLSSVRFADRICVLASGRIIETGTHDELLSTGGTYSELFEFQAQAYR